MKKKFYIIGHNPNSIEEVKKCLSDGANAIEPDIHYDEKKKEFYVYHMKKEKNSPLLKDYLQELETILKTTEYENKLAMITFDIKTPTFDINVFFELVEVHFANYFHKILILATVASLENAQHMVRGELFFNQNRQRFPNSALGIDGENDIDGIDSYFKSYDQKNYFFADGITSLLPGPNVFHSISSALAKKATGNSFKLVYAWTINKEIGMKNYIDLGVDGLLTDDITELSNLLKTNYKDTHELAKMGDNTFATIPDPAYILTVKTSDIIEAGTNSIININIIGSNGSLNKKVSGSYKGMFERGDVNHIVINGDVGQISSITVKLDDPKIKYKWHLSTINIKSNITNESMDFVFNQWIDENGVTISQVLV